MSDLRGTVFTMLSEVQGVAGHDVTAALEAERQVVEAAERYREVHGLDGGGRDVDDDEWSPAAADLDDLRAAGERLAGLAGDRSGERADDQAVMGSSPRARLPIQLVAAAGGLPRAVEQCQGDG